MGAGRYRCCRWRGPMSQDRKEPTRDSQLRVDNNEATGLKTVVVYSRPASPPAAPPGRPGRGTGGPRRTSPRPRPPRSPRISLIGPRRPAEVDAAAHRLRRVGEHRVPLQHLGCLRVRLQRRHGRSIEDHQREARELQATAEELHPLTPVVRGPVFPHFPEIVLGELARDTLETADRTHRLRTQFPH